MLKGVNLGGWLVLEKWMTPDLFDGTKAQDETYLCKELGRERAAERLKAFRDTFIHRRDFAEIADKGFNAVRIPVPFFLFEDVGPYIHCYEYLDRAFDWAEEFHLKILIDLHTAPGGHNGTDNSGICGVCLWSTRQEYVDYTLDVLERIAERYGKREALWGIEVLNEPICSDTPTGQYMNIHELEKFYLPAEPELAKENANYTLDFLKQFYRGAYTRMRRHMETSKRIVFCDAFELELWDEFLLNEGMEGVCLDTHHYLMTADKMLLAERNLSTYEKHLALLGERLHAAGQRIPLIVGEWNAQCAAEGLADMTEAEKDELYSAIVRGFQAGFATCLGWFYWSWKVLGDGLDADCDDACRCVTKGWLQNT
ncbi:MAG: cellulase family glycosylhydrolase [Clostridia bacterium]|nr:cellulase family glycosylhydrolase [Clostridia bacterium]